MPFAIALLIALLVGAAPAWAAAPPTAANALRVDFRLPYIVSPAAAGGVAQPVNSGTPLGLAPGPLKTFPCNRSMHVDFRFEKVLRQLSLPESV